MRIGPMSVFMFVTYIMIGIFDQVFDPSLNAYGNGAGGFLFATLLQPWNWSGTVSYPIIGTVPSFILILGSAIAVSAGIALTLSVLGRSDIAALFSLFLALCSLGAIPCVAVYNFVTRNIGMMTGCVVGQPCQPAMILGALSVGVLSVMWLWTCVEWWAWRPATQ